MAYETWKDIPGYEGFYQASSLGRIRSVERILTTDSGQKRKYRGRILKTPKNTRLGYRQFIFSINGKHASGKVHRAVALAFHGVPSVGSVCCHNDGNMFNNRPENLRWDTRKNNQTDMVKHGRSLPGERNPVAVLNDEIVRNVRAMFAKGDRQRDIMRATGLSRGTVWEIVRFKKWKHVV